MTLGRNTMVSTTSFTLRVSITISASVKNLNEFRTNSKVSMLASTLTLGVNTALMECFVKRGRERDDLPTLVQLP